MMMMMVMMMMMMLMLMMTVVINDAVNHAECNMGWVLSHTARRC